MRAALGESHGHGLLLGVTPELRALCDRITAVDFNSAMIEKWWRDGQGGPGQAVRQGDWLMLGAMFPSATFDFAISDACLNMLAYPHGQRALFGELEKVLKDGAPVVVRFFAAPGKARAERVEEVVGAAAAGRIGSVHAFKWRLAHALVAERGDPNIAVTAILAAFERAVPDRAALAAATGWPRAEIDTIDAYAGSANVYSFPDMEALEAVLPASWRIDSLAHGNYELAEHCPVIGLQRR
jgi:SAM-dependent methyltransferase